MNTDFSNHAYAPYNFIPFREKQVPVRYRFSKAADGKKEERIVSEPHLPGFNEHTEGTLSGMIEYDLEAFTDIAVGSEFSKEDGTQGKVRPFFRDRDGCPAVPGSTMRGFVRSQAEVLSLSYPEFITDERYLFRSMASGCGKFRAEYTDVIRTNQNAGRAGKGARKKAYLNNIEGVRAGLLYKTVDPGTYKETWYLRPMKNIGVSQKNFLMIRDDELHTLLGSAAAARLGLEKLASEVRFLYKDDQCRIPNHGEDGSGDEAKAYTPYRTREPFWFIFENDEVKFRRADAQMSRTPPQKGILLNSGWMDGKKYHYLVCGETVPERENIEIPAEDIVDYRSDLKRNQIQNKLLTGDFYTLPDQAGEENGKIFFYKKQDSKTSRLTGFGPTPYFRLFFEHNVCDGIKTGYHREDECDYVDAMFGFVGGTRTRSGEGQKKTSNRDFSYKSRLSFSNAVLQNPERHTLEERQLVLLNPKGTAFAMYVNQKGRTLKGTGDHAEITYNQDGFSLRGAKFYWKRSHVEAPAPIDKANIFSHMETLKADSHPVFHGKICFENLYPDELGLLLMSLRMKKFREGGHETRLLGSGKPYGYGKVEFSNIRLRTMDDKRRFTEINPAYQEMTGEQIDGLKDTYVSYMSHLMEEQGFEDTKLEEVPSIQVYRRYLTQDNQDDYLNVYGTDGVYMPVKEYSMRDPLPDAAEILSHIQTG